MKFEDDRTRELVDQQSCLKKIEQIGDQQRQAKMMEWHKTLRNLKSLDDTESVSSLGLSTLKVGENSLIY